MPKRRLDDLAASERQEARQAERWLKNNESALPPLLTDTDAVRDQVKVLKDPDIPGEYVRFERVIPLAYYGEREDDDEGRRFKPLTSQRHTVDVAEADLAVRVRRALDAMTEVQRDLLHDYYVGGKMWQDLRRKNESRQAVYERLKWARNSFLKSWLATAEQPVMLEVDDF